MNTEYARTLIDYHIGSNNHLWECIMALTDAQFVQPCAYSLGSVRHQLVHMVNVDIRWLARLQERELPPSLNPDDFTTRESVRARHDEIAAQFRAYVDGLDDAALARTVTYDMPHRGGLKTTPIWQIVAHVANHGTDHRGQVLRLLHDLGAPTFEQDLMIYLWGK